MTIIVQKIQLKHMVISLHTYFSMSLRQKINKIGNNYRGSLEAIYYTQTLTTSDEIFG